MGVFGTAGVRACVGCGGSWFVVERSIRIDAGAQLPTAPGAEPLAVALRVRVKCAVCGEELS